ncbi:sensor histidine kinase [Sphingomonas sp. AP4-R1]|uniref:sensor histidine kinase n=1 Tax=Sphingomonas sp. AP4-R1 TaxID=2735134 RepID=UPI001493C6CA|nr:PAS domain-containing sensor histidine kinase [Sphingomonas sp. AP4-R1]QJU57498.1 sensor histidine kinase [Sphingomonas sp. AP4-R1]
MTGKDHVKAPHHFPQHDGVMRAAIRAFAWEDTALGPPEAWPAGLKTLVATILDSRFPQCIVWGEGLVTIPNDAFLPILGRKPDALGRPFSDVWAEVWTDLAPMIAATFRGESTYIENFPLEVERGAGPERAWFTFCYSPIRDEQGVVQGMLDTVIETTDAVESGARAKLLADELAHRMKNTLAVFQSIAHQTFRSLDGEEAHRLLDQRLAALGAAHEALTQSEWFGAPLSDVVRRALAAHVPSPDRVVLAGPSVPLGGRQALSLALAVNELATNSAKYGAMSAPGGRIVVDWDADLRAADGPFRWRWREEGGPLVTPPKRRGFGSRLIERVLPADFGGEISADYRPEGFALELRARTGGLTDIG